MVQVEIFNACGPACPYAVLVGAMSTEIAVQPNKNGCHSRLGGPAAWNA